MQSVSSIVIEPEGATISYIGATVQLTATLQDQNEQPVGDAVVTWESSDESVATVSAQGLVTAVMNGFAWITARFGNVEKRILVDVEALPPTSNREVLTALYYSMGGPEWTNNTNWLSAAPLDDWHGVRTIHPGNVLSLSLEYNSLKGTLPTQLAQLGLLSALNLKGNQISGEIPAEIGLLTRLNTLDLSENDLTGSIPPELGDLPNMYSMKLGENNLTGSIPPELGQLDLYSQFSSSNLPGPTLDLGGNRLSGPIPSEMGNLTNVVHLNLSGNQLSGSIPPELGRMVKVIILDLSDNQFSGSIPPEFGNLVELGSLRLNGNASLSGPLPIEMITLERLSFLRLEGTQLCIPSVLEDWADSMSDAVFSYCGTGSTDRDALIAFYHEARGANWTNNDNWLSSRPLDQWFGISTDTGGRVEQLNLENNNLQGTVTQALVRLEALRSLNLGRNPSLTGPLPPNLVDLPLESIYLEGTQICAPAEEEFQTWLRQVLEGDGVVNCDQVVQLDRDALIELYHATDGPNWRVNDNWLSEMPLKYWRGVKADRTGRVTELELNTVRMKGILPAGIGRLAKLEKLDMAFNQLTGPIPPEIGTLTSLTELRIWGNQLTGEIPPEIGKLQNLTILDLSRNQLTGGISPELGQLNSLRSLKASHNRLSGMISPEIGKLENLSNLELHNNELTGVIPPEMGNLKSLEILRLDDNHLVGEIPPEIGRLNRLIFLFLLTNQLSGEIPPEIGQLGNLTELILTANQLSGEIPPEIGNLNNLELLWISENRFSGSIPPEIGQLADLTSFIMRENQFSGVIPPEIGELSALEYFWTEDNQLSGPIPPEIGKLGSMISLSLSKNQLSGGIPPELGKLSSMGLLTLDHNQLSGEIPPELGDLEKLEFFNLNDNENLSGPIPIELTAIGSLEELSLEGTQICAPDGEVFEEWLGKIALVQVDRCERSSGSMAYLTQATQSFDDYRVPLVAGEDALLRVFVIADDQVDAKAPAVRATFFQDGTEIHSVDIASSESTIPSIIDEGSLSASSNEIIPGSVIAPGLELVVEIDPERMPGPSSGIQSRIPEMGRIPINVRNVPGLDLTVVPLLWSEDPDYGVVMDTEGLTAEDDLFRPARYLLPILDMDFNLTVREPAFTSVDPVYSNHNQLVREVNAIRAMDGGTAYYMGVIRDFGGAVQPGKRGFVAYLDDGVIAHELGHTMGLFHAPCGTQSALDQQYPYSDGSIGAWGYDIIENKLVSPDTPDLMSFCLQDFWISDYHFRKALINRVRDAESRLALSASAPSRVMLVWGGIDGSDELVIEPSFVVDAPSYLPGENGPYHLAGYDVDGNTLFTLNFTMGEIVDGEGGGSFAFMIPIESGWSASLERISLSGPEGYVEMTKGSGRSTTLLVDQFTGEVRGFMRDVPGPDSTVQDARRVLPDSGLDVVVSPGIPDTADW